ncbi:MULTISPECIES: hypothetical protein [Corallococcus]|uniref:hypothetical protein n=1 Tax=Corallococcus TaxID=83461 RepID=UPI0011C3A86A|nr:MULTISPECIES: hypothetical protein [Corallococcus]MBN8472384.1 hypothetical protein [Corallococcus exiguus]NPC69209.1 hypothetical protein [Corallococcus exiguus]NPD24448.1 hypothetical protein [Corallococcus exiguus]NRD47620.1 hypothetical protein [Corallococcus exiguus]
MSRPLGPPPRPPGMPPPPEVPEVEPVGSAHMKPDGTLELRMSARGPGAIAGEALFILKPDHPRYAGVLDHLGPIEPGGYARVMPFPPGVF